MFPSLLSETLTSRKGTLVGECELVNFMVGQELIKRSLYLPYLASESTLSGVDLFIEHLPWEIQHAHCCKSQYPLGDSARPLL